ncbi:MAG: DNA mismatch repair protein MutS [Bacteroidota bacterium]|nr:DNA mismatch repair protein MutS [Bacteroidota bacterium]
MAAGKETPLMKQYTSFKTKYPDALLLFRVGDFYETFGEDAIKASQILGIVLTKRANGQASHIELAGFPYHSLDTYLPKLVRAGQRVAICEQLEDPKLAKGIVKRGVTELVSPGVAYSEKIVDHKSNNFLASIYFDKDQTGIAFLDISTGEFMAAQGSLAYIDKLLQSLKPAEVLISKPQLKTFKTLYTDSFYTYAVDDWIFMPDFAKEKLLKQFETTTLKGFGIDTLELGIIAAGAALHYVQENLQKEITHLNAISRLDESKYVWLDKFTIRNLEILSTASEKGTSLIDILDKTNTAMGSRLFKRWLVLPLKDLQPIQERLDSVEYFTKQQNDYIQLSDALQQMGDLERLISKVAMGRVNPRELYQLHRSMQLLPGIKTLCENSGHAPLMHLGQQLNLCTLIIDKIGHTVNADAPALLNKGGVINAGIDSELDELRAISHSGKDYLLQMQQREALATGITSLKIAYNNVFGYYIEVTHLHKNKVPPEWHRKQTLTNAERYITPELKVYEEKILGAEDKILSLEVKLYNSLVEEVAGYIGPVQQNAMVLAKLDCLCSYTKTAIEYNFCKPKLNEGHELQLLGCRHPVIERNMKAGEYYIPNDLMLNREEQQIIILTGPNMSGKSALLRQTALAVLMAQAGSFVACTEANIGLVDKVFTRVGASDNLSGGESTFMVEMTETASILNNLSDRSLILLDEIGRGTSTYDGVSLAWSITEFLNKQSFKPKTLFATHYHELNELEETHSGIKNYHISLKESGNKIIFLRKLLPGGSEHSFGIHVAKMAGIPQQVLKRANEILSHLEAQRGEIEGNDTRAAVKNIPQSTLQMNMFTLDDPLLTRINEEFRKIDLNHMTPMEALLKIQFLKNIFDKVE